MSVHESDSDISRLNRLSRISKNIVYTVHPWTYEVMNIAKTIFEYTNGFFDCGVVNCSWNQECCPCFNKRSSIQSIQFLGKNEICLREPIRIDLGGIAKGYAVDRGIEILKSFGIENAVINAGGDLRVIGNKTQPIYLKEKEFGNTYIFLGILLSAASGIVWFISEDILGLSIGEFGYWVKLHGVIGHLFLIVLGMAFYHHVQICVRMKKNLVMGSFFIASSVLLIASILALFYGRGVIHQQAHLMHLVCGSLFCFVFVLHIQIGRKSLRSHQKKTQVVELDGLRV